MELPQEAIIEYYNIMREHYSNFTEKEAQQQATTLLQLYTKFIKS